MAVKVDDKKQMIFEIQMIMKGEKETFDYNGLEVTIEKEPYGASYRTLVIVEAQDLLVEKRFDDDEFIVLEWIDKLTRKPGRPTIGVSKKLSVTLSADDWNWIEKLMSQQDIKSFSEYFRLIHLHNRYDNDPSQWGPTREVKSSE